MSEVTKSAQNNKFKYILRLDSPEGIAPMSVGAKASRLAEMNVKKYAVPNGFAVTTESFKIFCTHNNILKDLESSLYKEMPAKIMKGQFPEDMKRQIISALDEFSFKEYAVRSSSLAEDSMDHSMAGQFDTFLCIKRDSVLEKIKECWASMFNDAVIAYAEKNGLPISYKMGVVVQEQKHPVYAGVIFTIDPLTKSTDHIIIEWVDGMGDKLVSGEATPERMYVSRTSQVLPYTDKIAKKYENAFKDLVAYALKAENEFKHPVDMEWCIDEKGCAIVLQARPITGLTGDNVVIWTNVNMTENFPVVLSPFTWSVIDKFYQIYAQSIARTFGWSKKEIYDARNVINNLTGIQSGRIYYNMSNWYEGACLLPIGELLIKLIDSFLGQNVPFSFKPTGAHKKNYKGLKKFNDNASFYLHTINTMFSAEKHLKNYEREFYQKRSVWRKKPYNSMKLDELMVTFDELFYGVLDKNCHNEAIVDLHAAMFPGGLKLLLKKWLHKDEQNTDLLAVQLMQGLDVRSAQPMDIMLEIARDLKGKKELQKLLVEKKYDELEKKLDSKLRELFDRYMENFGGRCIHDSLIVAPTFEERHEIFWDLVEKFQRTDDRDPVEMKKEEVDKRKQVTREVVGKLPFFKKLAFKFVLKNAHNAIRRRERCRILRSLTLGEFRQMTLAMGKKLESKGYIKDSEDVFFLKWSEIEEISYGKFQFIETIEDLIEIRKKAVEENGKGCPPDFFIRDKAQYYDLSMERQKDAPQDLSKLRGVAISGGVVKARARVILDPVKDNKLEPGEILITKATDPGWTPLFKICGGLIIEKGGMLSHGAIVAREFGIPAIAGIEGATTMIKDGDLVYLNGNMGEIEIIERKGTET